jgi:hypothetical protein
LQARKKQARPEVFAEIIIIIASPQALEITSASSRTSFLHVIPHILADFSKS